MTITNVQAGTKVVVQDKDSGNLTIHVVDEVRDGLIWIGPRAYSTISGHESETGYSSPWARGVIIGVCQELEFS